MLYRLIKKFITFLVPSKILFHYETKLRYIHYLFLKGGEYHCNICAAHLKHFVSTKNSLICPRCGSTSRDRMLWKVVEPRLDTDKKILDFSPSRSIYRKIKNRCPHYIGSDLSGNFIADVAYDITDIKETDNSMDLLICFHVLEHVTEDISGMKELFRVLKPGGICLIQTPFKTGEIYENDAVQSPEDRKKHFGQEDHVRVYSVEGLMQRLQSNGLAVKKEIFVEKEDNLNGFNLKETILYCEK